MKLYPALDIGSSDSDVLLARGRLRPTAVEERDAT